MPPRDSPHLINNFVDHELLANPERYHSRDSPYFGLSLKEQKWLAKKRRPKGRTPKYITDNLREATDEDYQYLLRACTKALIHNAQDCYDVRLDRITLDLELFWNYRRHFPLDFPKGINLAYSDWSIFVRFRVDRIIDWLHKKKQSPYTAKQLRKNLWAMNVKDNVEELNFYEEYATISSINQLIGNILNDAESGAKRDRWGKGRRIYRNKSKADGTIIAEAPIDKPPNVCSNRLVVKTID